MNEPDQHERLNKKIYETDLCFRALNIVALKLVLRRRWRGGSKGGNKSEDEEEGFKIMHYGNWKWSDFVCFWSVARG